MACALRSAAKTRESRDTDAPITARWVMKLVTAVGSAGSGVAPCCSHHACQAARSVR